MNNFWALVGYEYKKILMKKSVIITFILAVSITFLCGIGNVLGYHYVDGKPSESKIEIMKTDKAYSKVLSGRPIDGELLYETAQAYAKIPLRDEYTLSKEYEIYARPYSSIRNIMTSIYSTDSHKFELSDLQNLTKEQANEFYNIRNKNIKEMIDSTTLNTRSKQKLLSLNKQISKPLVFNYADGYSHFLNLMYTTGIFITFVISICIAPIFSKEYMNGTDQLILSSTNGKKNLILAKIFTGVSLSTIISIILIAISYFTCMLLYGFDGSEASFQLFLGSSPYPITIGQLAIINCICVLLGNIFLTSIIMFLSAKFKSPFGVIVFISILIIVPMFFNIPENYVFWHNLLELLPINMMAIRNITSPLLYEFFGLSIEPYIFMPIFAVIASIIILPFAYKSFKNHQVA